MNVITPLIDDRCTLLGLTVEPPKETDGLHWELSHLWLTYNGSWDATPNFARDFQSDHLGGDHHVYVLGHRLNGERAEGSDLFVLGWPDDHHFFSPKEEHEYWGNAPINAGFNFDDGETGPYYAQMNALNSSIVRGIGLPYPPYTADRGDVKPIDPMHFWDGKTMVGDKVAENIMGGLHTSFFLVFQEVEAYEPEPPAPPVTDQFQRVLDKAEMLADSLTRDADELVAAAKVYLGIAELLSWM